MLVLKFG